MFANIKENVFGVPLKPRSAPSRPVVAPRRPPLAPLVWPPRPPPVPLPATATAAAAPVPKVVSALRPPVAPPVHARPRRRRRPVSRLVQARRPVAWGHEVALHAQAVLVVVLAHQYEGLARVLDVLEAQAHGPGHRGLAGVARGTWVGHKCQAYFCEGGGGEGGEERRRFREKQKRCVD